MAVVTTPAGLSSSAVLHPKAAGFTVEDGPVERRIGLLFTTTGVALVAAMGVLGLMMRLGQGNVIALPATWFYRLMTLHGAGMLTGVLVAMMGALWYVLRTVVPVRTGWMLTSYALIVAGAVAVLISTLAGFAAAWTFLPPLPFYPAGQWATWTESVFFIGMLLVGAGFSVFCIDVVEQTTSRYGGLARTLGWTYLFGRDETAPPPQAIAATVVAFDGLVASSAGMAIVLGLLGRTYDSRVGFDALVAKNLVYLFGHSIANLTIYLAAGVLYVIVPRYAGRSYDTTKPFVAAWMGSFVFILTAYSHHLYMDFVQPTWAEIVSEAVSYAALIPVAVITIYSMTMLIWGSRYHWTLASTLLYIGFAGWAIGGVGAVIDSVIPFNFRLHNTVWVVAHFHTYLLMGVVVWVLAFLAHLLERATGETTSTASRVAAVGLMIVGGYGLTGTWFVEGVLGIPRRYALQPLGTAGYSVVGASFALVFALGFLLFLVQLVPLARTARRRPKPALAARAKALPRRGLPLATPRQLAVGVAVCVAGLAAFFPEIVDASETGARYHHLDHAAQFFLGATLGLVVGSIPAVSRRLGERAGIGFAVALAAPTAMMLMMTPRLYGSLERHPVDHALYHVGMAALGLVAGLGTTRLGSVAGRLTFVTTVGMTVMFAAAMKGA